jgi:hypothetical protein
VSAQSRFVDDYVIELRSLSIPWISEVAEQAAQSVRQNTDGRKREFSETEQAVHELKAIREALDNSFKALIKLGPAILAASSAISSDSNQFLPSLRSNITSKEISVELEGIELSIDKSDEDVGLLLSLNLLIKQDIEERIEEISAGGPGPGPARGGPPRFRQ